MSRPHIHMREVLKYQTKIGEQRLITAAAVVIDGRVDDGTFLPLDVVPREQ